MTNKIIIPISDHPLTGKKRVIVFEGIQYLFYSMESAELIWLEHYADDLGQPLIDEILIPRKIMTPISNENKVTKDGILITRELIVMLHSFETTLELVKSTLPKEANEEEVNSAYQSAYEIELSEVYNSYLESGVKEFDFWMGVVNWEPIIKQACNLLESFKRFDRI